ARAGLGDPELLRLEPGGGDHGSGADVIGRDERHAAAVATGGAGDVLDVDRLLPERFGDVGQCAGLVREIDQERVHRWTSSTAFRPVRAALTPPRGRVGRIPILDPGSKSLFLRATGGYPRPM